MTKEEAACIYESIAERMRLQFTSYYKYQFTYCGTVDDVTVTVVYGGHGDDIYRYEVTNDPFPAPTTFDYLLAEFNYVEIKQGNEAIQLHNY